MTQEKKKVPVKIFKPYEGWQDEFVRCLVKRQMVKAGRRSGKTFGTSIKAVMGFSGICWNCFGEGCVLCDNTGKVKPKRVLYAAPTIEQVGAFWFNTVDMLGNLIEGGIFKKNENEHIIEYAARSEARIHAKTAWNASTMRGDWGDLVILEEYQMWNEDAWSDVVQPMLLDTDGTAIFIFTPPSLKAEGVSKARDPRHASKLYKKAQADETGRWKTFHATSFDNPKLSKTALTELTESGDMSADSYRREILAEDDEIQNSWLVYGKFDDSLCKIPRFEIPKTWEKISAHDFGKANPAALFAAQVRLPLPPEAPKYIRAGDYVLFREYLPGGGISTKQHVDRFREICPDVNYSLGGNITTEDEIRTAYTLAGWRINAPKINKVNAQLDKAITLIENKQVYIFEDLHGILGEIAGCMWELDEENKPLDKIKNEARFHLLACLRYLCSELTIRPLFKNTSSKIPIVRW